MKRLSFCVPGAPVPCARPRVYRSHTITDPRTEAYEQLVAFHALAAMGKARWARAGEGPFAVSLMVYRQARRGDADNFAKGAIDGMTRAGVWEDDRHVHELHVWLEHDKDRPRLEVRVDRLKA